MRYPFGKPEFFLAKYANFLNVTDPKNICFGRFKTTHSVKQDYLQLYLPADKLILSRIFLWMNKRICIKKKRAKCLTCIIFMQISAFLPLCCHFCATIVRQALKRCFPLFSNECARVLGSRVKGHDNHNDAMYVNYKSIDVIDIGKVMLFLNSSTICIYFHCKILDYLKEQGWELNLMIGGDILLPFQTNTTTVPEELILNVCVTSSVSGAICNIYTRVFIGG